MTAMSSSQMEYKDQLRHVEERKRQEQRLHEIMTDHECTDAQARKILKRENKYRAMNRNRKIRRRKT